MKQVIQAFKTLEEAEALALSGSKGQGDLIQDQLSDFDLYVYSSIPVPLEKRRKVLEPLFVKSSLGNSIYEETDNGVTSEGLFDIMYRSFDWIENEIRDVWHSHNARTGYTTCFVFNLQHSEILFDRNGRLTDLRNEIMTPYPDALAHNIISKNWPLIDPKEEDLLLAQINYAIKRGDRNSIIHRTATYFASYFDILFAVNRQPHPGEKKLVPYARKLCRILPDHFEHDINLAFDSINTDGIAASLEKLSEELHRIMA